jgi:hypothetical protein
MRANRIEVSVCKPLGQVNLFVHQPLGNVGMHIDGNRAPMNRASVIRSAVFVSCGSQRFSLFGHAAISQENRKQNWDY